jgi:hypothetical protein
MIDSPIMEGGKIDGLSRMSGCLNSGETLALGIPVYHIGGMKNKKQNWNIH